MPNKLRPKTPSRKARRIHYVLSTHWDREWLHPFQVFRHRLVRLMDRTLAALESGELRGPFTIDGQSIPLEDYLEIRPQHRARVTKLLRNGKLKAGPWYVLPEEWLVSGESFVRNLRLGRQIVRELGGQPSDAGFICDLFGHIGQLPQIFAGFGIKGAFLWRGIEPRETAHFIWEGTDGTRLPTYRFGRAGYGDYTYDVRRSTQPDTWFDDKRSRRDHIAFIAKEVARTTVPPVLVFDGGDHLQFDSDHYRVLRSLKPSDGIPGPIEHTTLDEYLDDLLPHVGAISDVVHGELREFAKRPMIDDQQWYIPGVLSSRVNLKHANAYCQSMLCHWAEPFGFMARVFARGDDTTDFLTVAWRWLLQNHPHDSIGGCCIDEVHDDMLFRFAQCRQIGDRVTSEALRILSASVEGSVSDNALRVLVANPLPRPVDDVIELTLQIPSEWRSFNEFFGFEPKPGFRIYDADGREIPYQRVAQEPNRTKYRASCPAKFPVLYKTNDITVALHLALPALGYRVLTIREGDLSPSDEIVASAMLPTRHPETPGLATSERSMENEHIAVTIESNGAVTLTDKRTGESYSRLLVFENTADIGDGWYHGAAVNDQAYVSTAAHAEVALVHNGPLLTAFRVRTTLRVPADFDFNRMVRSCRFSELVIDCLLTLRANTDRLEVCATVQNHVRDHRLRVLFPSGAQADTYLSDGAFDVVERVIALPKDNHQYRELAVETGAQQTWSAVFDSRRGLAVISSGLLECCVRDQNERPLVLTLFRATGRTIMTDGQPGGQLQGELISRFWIVPLRGAPDRVRLCELGMQLACGLRTSQLTSYDVKVCPTKAVLPPVASLCKVSGSVVITSAREVESGLEIRLFNPNPATVDAQVDFAGRPSSAPAPRTVQVVNFESRPAAAPVALRDGLYAFSVRPKQILTLRFN